jgi:hypothetical protein
MSHFLSVLRLIATFNIAGLEFAMSVWKIMQICGLYRCVAELSDTAVYPRRICFRREFVVTIFAITDLLVTNHMRDISSNLQTYYFFSILFSIFNFLFLSDAM